MTQQKMRQHAESMLAGETSQPATLYLGEDVIEAATGKSRGEGSISVQAVESGLLVINDEVRGYRGTVRPDDFYRILDEEARLAQAEGRTLRFEAGQARDRQAMWREFGDDAGRGAQP